MRAVRGLIVAVCLFVAAPLFAFYPQWVRTSNVSSARVGAIATGDFNEDGRPDVVARTSQTVILYLLKQDGTLATPGVIVQAGGDTSEPVVGDMNGDGNLDIVVGDNSAPPEGPADQTSLIVYPGHGDGTFGNPITTLLSFSPSEIDGGDFNNDGKPDLAIRSYASAMMAIYSCDGTGHFTESMRASLGESAVDLAVGDIDHDGNADVAVAYEDAKPFRIYFGHGDATFDAPVDFTVPSKAVSRVIVADLDHDHDLELLFSDFDSRLLTVAVNTGSRTFATPVVYSTGPQLYDFGDPWDMVADDFDQDGNVDVVVLLINTKALATFPGNGNGTLRNPVRWGVPYGDFPFVAALADITGDSRLDLFVGTRYAVDVFENRSGDLSISIRPTYPTITVGQPAQFYVETCLAAYGSYFCSPAAPAQGTITLRNNGAAIGSGVLSGGIATIDVPSPLPLGTHSITAEFPGDTDYHAAVSDPVSQKVINERTTTTVQTKADVEYGEGITITTEVTSPLPDPLGGSFWLFTNDVRSQYALSAPKSYWFPNGVTPGTYQYYAAYEGNATQPPSVSEVFTQIVRKGRTTASIPYGSDVGRYGSQSQLYVEAHTTFTSSGIEHVKLYEGSALIGETGTYSGTWVNVNLPAGVHYLQAVYDGNDKFEPARSQLFRFTVLPAGFVLDAYATGTSVRIAAYPTAGNSYVMLSRRAGNGAWQPATYMYQNPMTDTNLAPGVYSYRAELHEYNSQQLLATSNVDVAIVGANFSDDPLLPGQSIRSAHISELLSATNTLLAAGGFQAITIPDAGPGQPIRASHIITLRNAINQARTALGMANVQWVDIIAPGGMMRAAQIMELRDALR